MKLIPSRSQRSIPQAFVAVKLTALANPVDLKLAAELIVEASGHVDLANMALPPAHLSLDAAPMEARMLLARGEQRYRNTTICISFSLLVEIRAAKQATRKAACC